MKINQLTNNQFTYIENGKNVFQSYNSIIVIIENGKVTLDNNLWNCSRTTSKYRNIFLGETTKETEQKIKDGTYKLSNLN